MSELTIVDSGGLDRMRYEPRDFGQLQSLAKWVAASELCPKALQENPRDVMLVLMQGAQLGLPAMASLQNLHAINGRVGMAGQLMLMLAQADEDVSFFEVIEATAERAVVRVIKHSWPEDMKHDVVFTFEEAQEAGLLGKKGDMYKKWRKDMLQWRAVARAVRRHVPRVAVMGATYLREELQAIATEREEESGEDPVAAKILEGVGSTAEPKAEPEDVVDAEEVPEEEDKEPPNLLRASAKGNRLTQKDTRFLCSVGFKNNWTMPQVMTMLREVDPNEGKGFAEEWATYIGWLQDEPPKEGAEFVGCDNEEPEDF